MRVRERRRRDPRRLYECEREKEGGRREIV